MSARQIDEALTLWNERLSSAAQNLLDLQSHPIYRRIAAADANLSGETAEKAGDAVRTLGYLLQCYGLLQNAIDRAGELRRDMPTLFGADERERQIIGVLQGKSIHLPTVQLSLKQRSLVSSIENVDAISPVELLTFMESAFEKVKQIVLGMETAWEAAGTAIEQAGQRLRTLRPKSQQLSAPDRVELERLSQSLQAVQQSASQDPLGSTAGLLGRVNEALLRINSKVEQRERERLSAQEAVAAARNLWNTLTEAHEAARAAYAEAREKTGCMVDFNAADEKLQALIAWFDRLASADEATAPQSVLVGLRNWTTAASAAIAEDTAIVGRAGQSIALRTELRGRLDALKAKARAYSLAENTNLLALADRAAALLYRRPTPLDEAASLVAEYEASLNLQTRNTV